MGTSIVAYESQLADRRLVAQFNAGRFDKDLRFAAEKQFALQCIAKNEMLQECTPESLKTALLDVAYSGLSLAPTKAHGYLIPYRNGGKVEAQFSPGYRGMLYLVHKAETIKSVQPGLVCQNDRLKVYTKENQKFIDHEEATKNRGPVTHAYVIAHFTNGGTHIEVIDMAQLAAVEKAATARNAKGGAVWRSAFREQMMIKAVIRRAWKFWPQDKAGVLEHAMETVNRVEPVDFTPAPDPRPEQESELCVSDEQVLQLHAYLTDREVPKADKWIEQLAKAMGAKAIEQLPAARFDEAFGRLKTRYETWKSTRESA
jgi:phage RecT family recombinase